MAALCARMTTNIDAAAPSSAAASCQPRAGSPRLGSPRGTFPTTATPWLARPTAQLTMIAMITAISGPGIWRVIRRAATTITMTPIDIATSARCACGSARAVFSSLGRVCLPAAVTPSMSGSWPAATWMPTPVRNPTSTVRERKFARKPSRASRATSSITPASRAASPASRTYRSDPATAMPVSAAASMAAVAESAATTRWRDEPRTANTAIGRSIVYKPVTSGIPAIFAYPSTSGTPRAASVRPASISMGTRDRSMGSTPCRTGWARSHPRQRSPREAGIISPPPGPGRSSGLVHHLATWRSAPLTTYHGHHRMTL